MNKSLISLLLTLLILLVGTTACDRLLDVKPLSSITEEVYFQNEGDFEPNLTGIYSTMRSLSNNVTFGMERGEELVAASNSRFGVAWAQNITPTSGAVNYNEWYRAIGHCNLLLAKIEGFDFASNPDTRKRIVAETYCLRAFFYFHLSRVVGDAPLMLQAIVDENVPLLPRAPATDVLKQVQSDLDEAIKIYQSITGFSARTYPSKYRFSYGAAQALKADAAMWSAKVLGGGAADFNRALAAINEVEATGVSLNADFRNVTGLRATSNPEIILSAFFSRDETGGNYGVNALPFLTVIQGAVNLDSIPYAQSSGFGQGAYQISPLSRNLFAANPKDKRIPFTWVVERQPAGPRIAWITKYPGTKYSDDRVSDNEVIMYRLADLYLLKAEAHAALGNNIEAVTSLNRVRARAGIGDYAGPTTRVLLEQEILNERGRELYFENKRWYDLVRFHKGGTLDIYKYIPNLIGKKTPLFWPLNTTVLGANSSLTQTEGY